MKLVPRPALRRLAVIDEKLRRQTWPNASTLARELEVNPRTIQRDIEYLRDQRRAPIAFDPRKNGYYYTEPTYQLPYFSVSEGECVARAATITQSLIVLWIKNDKGVDVLNNN